MCDLLPAAAAAYGDPVLSIHPAYAQVAALLTAVTILIAGNGLLQTLVPLSAAVEGFPQLALGLIGSAYFVGMFIGCLACPRIVAHAGHIRAFAAFVAVAAVTALAHPLFVDPLAWIAIRAVTGFCFAGLYATAESWMHDKAENVMRGQLIATYQIVQYAGQVIGQQAIRLASPTSFALFSVAASGLILSILPLAYTRADPPTLPPVPRLRMIWLYRISPVAVIGALAAGAANGTLWSLLPVFAQMRGFDAGGVATLMTVAIFGAAVVQWPVGRLADRGDRRVILLIGMAIGLAAEAALVFLPLNQLPLLAALIFLVGCSTLIVYPLSSSHAVDLAGREHSVEVSTGLLLTYTIGAIAGPTLAAAMMGWLSPEALFIHNGAIHIALSAFVLWRMRQRPLKREPSV